MMWSTVLSTFGFIFLAELPDKTALAALILATQFRARDVILGAWLAFLVQTIVAVVAGHALTLLPARPVHFAAGIGFLIFAWMAMRRGEEEFEVKHDPASRVPVWLKCFLVVFAAEWGDLTQLATAALIARTGQTLAVAIGAVLALWTVTVLAALTGSQMGRFLSPRALKLASAALCAIVGIAIIATS